MRLTIKMYCKTSFINPFHGVYKYIKTQSAKYKFESNQIRTKRELDWYLYKIYFHVQNSFSLILI
jgi:hypothetical protein